MIITRTPFRVSYFGGGSDLPAYLEQEGEGAVLSAAVDKHLYLTLNHRFDEVFRVSHSEIEVVMDPGKIRHDITRETLLDANVSVPVEISTVSDIPGDGMGSSGAYAVGLLKALHALDGDYPMTRDKLARKACDIEIGRCKKPVGHQDQFAVAFGGFRLWMFRADGDVEFSTVRASPETIQTIERKTLLVYSGRSHKSEAILGDQASRIRSNPAVRQKLKLMADLAKSTKRLVDQNSLSDFGRHLRYSWSLKRNLAEGVTNDRLDALLKVGRENGSEGEKALGAGGGGFVLFYAEPDAQEQIKRAVGDLPHCNVRFDNHGSHVICRPDRVEG